MVGYKNNIPDNYRGNFSPRYSLINNAITFFVEGTAFQAVRRWLFVALVILAPFSFIPSFALPIFELPSFRIGIYQILALVFVLICLPLVVREYVLNKQTKEDKFLYGSVLMLIGISVYGLVGALYPARSILMSASFCFLLVLLLCSRWYAKSFGAHDLIVSRSMAIAGVFYGIVSIAQLVIASFEPSNALLCSGCTSEVFGFPRINGFAAEPLFWANAIIPFWVSALVLYAKSKTRLNLAALVFTTLAITLTFSRGAYLAVGVVLIIFLCGQKLNNALRTMIVVGTSFILGFSLMILSASVIYSDSPGIVRETGSGIVEQLTFGRVSFATIKDSTVLAPTVVPNNTVDAAQDPGAPVGSEAVTTDTFDSQGYVNASTDDRTSSASLAIKAWYRPSNILLGVGLGNLGSYVSENIATNTPTSLTVYIFYVLMLAEIGLLGLLLILLLFYKAIRRIYTQDDATSQIIFLVMVAFFVHFFFFGSHINVVYVWLWLGLSFGYTSLDKRAPQSFLRWLIQWNRKASAVFDRLFVPASWIVDGLEEYVTKTNPKLVKPKSRICDVGGGKRPFVGTTLPKHKSQYIIGIDISRSELESAPEGIYDETIVADIGDKSLKTDSIKASLIICEAVLEHVKDTEIAVQNISRATKKGGHISLFLPSRNALFAILNRVLPEYIKRKILFSIFPNAIHAQGFPAYYNNCTPNDICRLLADNKVEVAELKCYYYSNYFSFCVPLHVMWRAYQGCCYAVIGRQAVESFSVVGIKT